MEKQIFVANSAYSLFLYLLKHTNKIENTLFVLGPSIRHARVPSKLALPDTNNFTDVETVMDAIQSLGIDFKNAYVNVQSIGDALADRLATVYPVTALSDGLSDFQNFPKYMAANRFTGYYRAVGMDENSALLNHPALETDTLQGLWQNRSQSEQLKIAAVFNVNAADLTELNKKGVIVVTQPLSEDGILSEQEKRCFYADIASNYPAHQLVIKPHPREQTPWQDVFPEVPIISNRVPMELLALMVPVKKLATFYSTAGTNIIEPGNVDFYSQGFESLTFVHPEKSKMGTTPYVNIEERLKGRPFNWCRVPNKSKTWYRPVSRNTKQRPYNGEHVNDNN